MVVKGLSIPVFGKYKYDPATKKVSYTDGVINSHAISYTAALESTENNPLYGDNRVIENDKPKFSSGTLTLGVDGLGADASKSILGIKILEAGEDSVAEEVYDDDQNAPELGVGIIETHQENDIDKFRAVIFTRVTFNLPEYAATTKGESVEWQTKEIEGIIGRSEQNDASYKHPWKIAAWFDTEDEAKDYLKKKLGVVEGTDV